MDYDVLIIGGGPAGTKCAMELGESGKKVGLIEKDAIGGVCLNRGCIPSKTYLYMAEVIDTINKSKRHGLEAGNPEILWQEAKKRKDMNIKMLGIGLRKTLQSHQVEILAGVGSFLGDHKVELESEEGKRMLTAEHIVIATGTQSLFIPGFEKGGNVITTTKILDLSERPQSLAIIGGGVSGVEMASAFAVMGTEVTLFEKYDSLLQAQDREITAYFKNSLEKKGCTIHLEVDVQSVKDNGEQAQVDYKMSNGEERCLLADKALVVIGRIPNHNVKDLQAAGINSENNRVTLNEYLQTSLPHVYLIGDAAGRNLTAYGGEREGQVVAAHILGKEKRIDYDFIPVTVFSDPEVAQIGLTEEQTQEKGISYIVKRSEYAANAKAIIMGEREGMVKIIVEEGSQKILGVHIIGVHASDLIHQAIIPVMQGMTAEQWLEAVWSHPVLSEVIKSALEASAE